ncbi:hypothetical protein HOY82DRAFT_543130 [Tuber indicum]|nr:hypothetical protein HOY82DRAFT_543130 [Tuber indicum]
MYNYLPPHVRNYGTAVDSDIFLQLEKQVQNYDLDAYLTEKTQLRCITLLELGGYAVEYTFHDDHRAAYIYLRQALNTYILTGGSDISTLTSSAGAEQWITENSSSSAFDEATPGQSDIMNVDFTDSEEEIEYDESQIIDHDVGDELDDSDDDGLVLNIL